MSTSLLDVLVGQRVRLTVTEEVHDPAKGEERSHREVEIVGQLLSLPAHPARCSISTTCTAQTGGATPSTARL
jgi:hypothetical protein